MTPRQFLLLARMRRQEIMRQEFGPALICTAISAIVGVKRSPYDFMPSMVGKRKRKTQTWEDQLRLIKAMHASIGGTDGDSQSR